MLKKKSILKIAAMSVVAAFCFSLTISLINLHNRNAQTVYGEDASTSWSYNSNNKTLECGSVSTYPKGFIDSTNQTSVVGLGTGQYEITYNVQGYASGAMQSSTDDFGDFVLVFINGSYEKLSDQAAPYGIITAYPNDIDGLNSETPYEIYVNVLPTGDMNQQGSGGGTGENGTVIYYDASVGFYYGTTERVELTVTKVDFTGSNNFVNGSAIVYLTDDDNEYSTTMSNVSLEPVPTEPSGGSYTGAITGYIDESQCTANGHPLESVILNYEVESTPEPPALSTLEWYFNGDMGYFSTNSYNDGYYSFSLNTNIVSVIYDRANATLTANCTIEAAEGNMPEEYYEAEISFFYTNAFGSVVEQVWHFNDAQCEATIEDKENLFFSVDQVSLKKIGWYYEEDLRYYIEENVEASWNIDHCEYRKEGSRDEFIIYMDVVYNNDHIFPSFDVIQINSPDFDDSPYPGQTIIGKGVNGWCDKLQQYIIIPCNSVPFAYYADGWSYDAYNRTLVYISSENIELEYELTSVNIDTEHNYYNLTYTTDGDAQTIVVSNASYIDETLTGIVTLSNGGDSIDVSLHIPESIVNPGSTYDEGWTYEADNQKLVYYLEEYGVFTLSSGTHNIMDKIITLSYVCQDQTMTIELDYSGGEGGYDNSAMTASGYATLNGSSSSAEFVTVLLQDSSGNTIPLNVANTWVFDGSNVAWINANSNLVAIDDLRQNMTESTFYVAEVTDDQFCEIKYTYDGRVLPTLTITQATFEERELSDSGGIEYVVSGVHEASNGLPVTVTIPSEFWKPTELEYYVVSFDANGGQGQMDSVKIIQPADGGSVVYSLPTCEFTKDDCNFVGWATESASADTIQPEDEFDLTEDQTFYAIWSESPREYTFNITFRDGDATGGSMEDVTITSSTYQYEYTLPICGYQKEGYEFAGWIYLSSGTSTKYQPGDTCTLDCDFTNTFLATWTAGEFVTITFNANGGEGTMEPITVENGSTQTVPGCDFTNEGYDFVEWAVGSPSSPTTFKPGDSVTVDDNYTLYAVWEATPKQYWVNDNGELKFVDEKHPEYLTRIDKVIYSESKSTATVLISIVSEENPDAVIDTKYISLSSAKCEGEIVTGYFNLIVEGEKMISIEGVPITYEVIPTTDEEKAADISQDQIDQINSLLPESQDSRVDDVIKDLNQGTAYQIVEVASDAKTFIDELRQEGGEGYTEEDYQRDLQTVQSATEAAVVVGAASKDANIAAQVEDMTKSIPDDHGVDLSGVLKEFYEQQMSYLLGEEVASKEGETPSKGRTRALAPKVNKVDVNDFLKQEFDQMLDFVDRSVVNIEGTLLQVRKCSHASVKIAVNQTITKITTESFRNFDKDKADREFVEKLEPVMMATMQSQVLATLEEEYNKSNHRNKEKDQVMLDEIEAIKDIETFRIIVMEVLRQKYEALTGITYGETAEDLQKFTDEVYWPVFEAWALDKDSPNGITFEELTKATIETSTKRANNFTYATTAGKSEIILISVFAGVGVVLVSGAIIVPTVLKKKRRGLSE